VRGPRSCRRRRFLRHNERPSATRGRRPRREAPSTAPSGVSGRCHPAYLTRTTWLRRPSLRQIAALALSFLAVEVTEADHVLHGVSRLGGDAARWPLARTRSANIPAGLGHGVTDAHGERLAAADHDGAGEALPSSRGWRRGPGRPFPDGMFSMKTPKTPAPRPGGSARSGRPAWLSEARPVASAREKNGPNSSANAGLWRGRRGADLLGSALGDRRRAARQTAIGAAPLGSNSAPRAGGASGADGGIGDVWNPPRPPGGWRTAVRPTRWAAQARFGSRRAAGGDRFRSPGARRPAPHHTAAATAARTRSRSRSAPHPPLRSAVTSGIGRWSRDCGRRHGLRSGGLRAPATSDVDRAGAALPGPGARGARPVCPPAVVVRVVVVVVRVARRSRPARVQHDAPHARPRALEVDFARLSTSRPTLPAW